MKSVDHNARLPFPTVTTSAPAMAMVSMVVCPAFVRDSMPSPQLSSMAAMYRVAYEAAQRSVRRAALVRSWSEPSLN